MIESQPDVVRMKEGYPLLRYAVQVNIGLAGDYRLSLQIVELLLHNGSCPNQICNGYSAWDLIQGRLETLTTRLSLSISNNVRLEIKDYESPELLKATRIFLLNGAVVNGHVYKILEDLESEFPDDAKELRAIAVAQEALNQKPHSGMVAIPLAADVAHGHTPTDLAPAPGPRPAQGSDMSDVDIVEEAQNNQALDDEYPTLSDAFCDKGGPYSTEDGRLDIAAHQLPQSRRRKWSRKLCYLKIFTSLKSKSPGSR
jgi:hypothetical protein